MAFRGGTVTSILCCSLHTVFNTHCRFHRLPIHLNFHSLPFYKPQFGSNYDEFLPWLEQKAGSEISSSLSIGKSSYGRSLFASKIIQTGDCILKVPYRVQITQDNLLPEIRSLIGEDVGNIAKLAVVILIEKQLGQGSEWYPYISCLPQLGELHNTVFWNKSELEMISPSSVYQETIDQKCQIEKDFLALKPVFECFHQSFGDFTYKDFMHACALVGSRAWGGTKGLALIPFADFVNHDGVSEAIVLSDDDKQLSEIIADRDYAPSEQVLIRYGKFSNATLMLDFGFTIPYNIYDQVQIQFDIPKVDPLHDMKLELLHRYYVPPPEHMKGLTYPVNSFSVKEVRSDRGKGKGLPQSLRALARVLSCTTLQELEELDIEAAQTDGRLARRPLQDTNKEIQAHTMLLSLFTQLIEERKATIMSLDSSYSPSLYERLSVRRLMAQDLLQVLHHEPNSNNHTNINILFLSMVNNLPPGSEKLFFVGNFQATQYELVPGEPWTKLTNFEVKNCMMIWRPHCVQFDVYNPKDEGDHQKIYWSMRQDGIYHSWDNTNWDKRTGWGSC